MNVQFVYGNNVKQSDVTNLAVDAFVRGNQISIDTRVSFNEFFGDVMPGQLKVLKIKYLDDNVTIELPETRINDYTMVCHVKTIRPSLDLCSLLKVDKIFLLNLASRGDRLEQSRLEFSKLNVADSQWERFEAFRGADEKVQRQFHKDFTEYCKNQPINQATHGAFGCLLSHYAMIKTAKERGYKRILILEDDFETTPAFNNKEILKKIGNLDFDMFYLSMTTLVPPLPTSDPDFVCVQRVYSTGAYIINNTVFDTIINQCLAYAWQIDIFYANVMQKRFKVYSLPKSVIVQRPGFSDIEQKDVHYQF